MAIDDIVVGNCEDQQKEPTDGSGTDQTKKAPVPTVVPHLPVPDKGDIEHHTVTSKIVFNVFF